MKHTEQYIQLMYDYTKEQQFGGDIYSLKRLYNNIAEEFNLDIAFGVDGNEYGGDDSIYCYVYVNTIGSIVFNRNCKRYDDEKYYKDLVNYLLELEEEAIKIKERLLPILYKY